MDMNVPRIPIWKCLIFIFLCGCSNETNNYTYTQKQDVLHVLNRYCFQDKKCTETVYARGNKLNTKDYFSDNCSFKKLNFKFIEDTISIKPIILNSSLNRDKLQGYADLFGLIGTSVLYQNFLTDCILMQNIFVKGNAKDNIEGYLEIFNKKYWTTIELEYDDSVCLNSSQLKLNAELISPNTYSFEFNSPGFYLNYVFKELDISNPENHLFNSLFDKSSLAKSQN